MNILCPVKKCVWGSINSLDDLKKYIAKSGQPFGVDMSGPACEVNPAWPCSETYYQHLGFGLHKGIDIPVSTGTEIYASTNGKVCEISDDITKGIGVVVYDAVQHIKVVCWHLLSHSVKLGDIIKVGQLIGLSDNTGYSKGPHLHFEVKRTDEHGLSIESFDPMPYISFEELMTENDVKALQALEGYQDPAGVQYWVGKPLSEYLKARLADKVKQIQDLHGNI